MTFQGRSNRPGHSNSEDLGYVSTVGLDEHMVRAYIRNQEDGNERYDQMKLEMGKPPRAAHGLMGAFEALTISSHRIKLATR